MGQKGDFSCSVYVYFLILYKEYRPLYYLCFSKSSTWILSFPSHHCLRSVSISTISSFEYLLLNRHGLPKTGFSSLPRDLVESSHYSGLHFSSL